MQSFNIEDLCHKCEPFETGFIEQCKKPNCGYKTQVWDNKFGFLEDHATERMKEQAAAENVVIGGVGKDAEIVVNEKGGKQSKSPMAIHLVDPSFLMDWAINKMEELEYTNEDDFRCVEGEDCNRHDLYNAVYHIAKYMKGDAPLSVAADYIESDSIKQLTRIASVLQYGASRYEPNNWRLIPQEEHINHALIHIIAHLAGDTQDDHLDHALCRLMMAYATEVSDGFDYCTFVDKRAA